MDIITYSKAAKVEKELNELSKYSVKMPVTPSFTTTNEYIKAADGTTASSSSWKASSLIDISNKDFSKITINVTLYGGYLGAAFYNAQEGFISGISGANASDYGRTASDTPQTFDVTPPNGTKFVRLSGYKSKITTGNDIYLTYYTEKQESIGNIAELIGKPENKNLVDPSKFTENTYIKGADGTAGASNYFDATDYILLKANTMYYAGNFNMGTDETWYHAFYSARDEKTFLLNPDLIFTRYDTYSCTILVKDSDVYVRFSAPHTKTNFYISAYADYYTEQIPVAEEEKNNTCRFKNILVIGDSISSDAYGDYKKWVTDLVDEGYFPQTTNNNSQHATGYVARYNSQANDFISRVTAVQDKEKYDLVITFGGVNDANQLIPMGEESDTDYTTYFGAAVRYYYKYLCTNFVNARIAVLLPLPCSTQNRDASVRGVQYTYSDYQKTVAARYSLPVLDLTNHGGFYPDAYKEGIDTDAAQAFRFRWTLKVGDYDPDGIHPTYEYEKRYLAPMIKKFIDSL